MRDPKILIEALEATLAEKATAVPPADIKAFVAEMFAGLEAGKEAACQIDPEGGVNQIERLNTAVFNRTFGLEEIGKVVLDHRGKSLIPKPTPSWWKWGVSAVALVALVLGYLAWTGEVKWHRHFIDEGGRSYVTETSKNLEQEVHGWRSTLVLPGEPTPTPDPTTAPAPSTTGDDDFKPTPTPAPAPAPVAPRSDGREDF